MQFISVLVSFFKNLFSKVRNSFLGAKKPSREEIEETSQKYMGEFVDDLPLENEIEDNKIYIVGENGYEWQGAFNCPCGCGDLIQLNLLEGGENIWRIASRNSKKISITPSINRTMGCKSHFTVTNGKVRWWNEVERSL